jgi:peptide/nickel transport system substrate-binding protein
MVRWKRVGAVLATVALLAAACSSGTGGGQPTPGGSSGGQGNVKAGGVFRIGLTSDVHEALDPAREYYTIGWEFLHCCLTRTLLAYNFLGPTKGGNDLVPDLATEAPTVSDDGLTWTFHIRPNVHYAPPLQDVTVTAQDFIRGILREAESDTASSYPFYYSSIQGFDDVTGGKATSISGLSAPDPQTLEIKLNQPTGDFPYTMTLPAMSPIPPSPSDPSAPLGAATGHDQTYGQFLVSTGPYMFQGADKIDYTKPADQQTGPSGYQAGKSYVLVRNPSWKAADDPIRKAYLDEIDVTVGGTVADLQNKIQTGELDTMDALPNPQGIQTFEGNPDLKPFLHAESTFGTYYINMNLAMAPFDDVHVRKAMNWVVDKAGLLRLAGGSVEGSIAHHDIPDSMLPNLASYNPYATPGDSGDVAKAKQEMAQSKYDSNQDGTCDAKECQNVLMVIDQTDPFPKMAALIQQNMQSIGISVNIRQFETTTMYTKCEDATAMIPLCPSEGWYADFADPAAFVTGLFSSASLTPSCCDDSVMGATSEQLQKWGYSNTSPTPNMDSQLNACFPLPTDQRPQCYEQVDHALMEQTVPWVPFRFASQVVITSPRVANYQYDAAAGWISLSQVALANGGK